MTLGAVLVLCLRDDPVSVDSAPLSFPEGGPLKTFELPAARFAFTPTVRARGKNFTEYEIKFPSAVSTDVPQNNVVPARIWIPAAAGPVPGLVLVHYLAPNHDFLGTVGASLAKSGVASMLFELPYYGPRASPGVLRNLEESAKIEDVVSLFRQAVLDCRLARDVLRAMPGVNPERVGVMGISLGALVAATAAGVDPGFFKIVLVVGGGDLAKIAFHDSRETARLRERLAAAGVDEERAREILKPVDPLTFAGRLDAAKVLMFNMKRDEVIPRACTDALASKIGQPTQIWYEGRHEWVALYVFSIVDRTVKFVKSP